ncbi:MAG: DUF3472 domain-containing protein [Prevotellaceae bacterium]|nr:DUF3472 domain-containing protein [Candidatus Faecinaster equi]
MKKITLIILMFVSVLLSYAQAYQAKVDTMWGDYHYNEINGKWCDARTSTKGMTSWDGTEGLVKAYYWRIPAGHVRASLVVKAKAMKRVTFTAKLMDPVTRAIIKETTATTTKLQGVEETLDILPDVVIPKDDFYRLELTVDNPANVALVKYFLFKRESTDPVLIPRNFGGTSTHIFDWASTDPNAPSGNAYDWVYMEAMVPYQYQYPGTYYMTIGAGCSYMGIQTNGRQGTDDFDRRVLFSVWDNGNMDEDPNLPAYMRSSVMDGNEEAVTAHQGGEGSAGTAMFKDGLKWWRPDHWVQFLLYDRLETSDFHSLTEDGRDSVTNFQNTIMTAWYKMDYETEWRYIATIRAAMQNDLISGWYSFIEPFTSAAGQFKHRAYYRHPFMRSAASGEWYNRNKLTFIVDNWNDRSFHYDFGRGATTDYDNATFIEMGGYGPFNDSCNILSLCKDKTCVDTINLDALRAKVDAAILKDCSYDMRSQVNLKSQIIPRATWKLIGSSGSGAQNVIDGNYNTTWNSHNDNHYLEFEAKEPTFVSAICMHYCAAYDTRCRYVDLYTSEDGKTWTLRQQNLELKNVDDPEVTLTEPLTSKYFKLQIHGSYTTSNFQAGEIWFKGEYNMDYLKYIAKTQLDNADCLQFYQSKDLVELERVYAGGLCTDATALATAIREVGNKATRLKFYQTDNVIKIGSNRAYILKNANGLGYLCATPEGKIVLKGATVDDATEACKESAPVNDYYNNWMVLRDEKYSGCYLYNIGLQKFVNLDTPNMLSDEPYSMIVRQAGAGFCFYKNSSAIVGDPTKENSVTIGTASSKGASFMLCDNYFMQPKEAEAKKVLDRATQADQLKALKAELKKTLDIPEGYVGSIADPEDRKSLEEIYNDGDLTIDDAKELKEVIDESDILRLTSGNAYKIECVSEKSAQTPFLTVSSASVLGHEAEQNIENQIWSLKDAQDGGFTVTSQGKGLGYEKLTESSSVNIVSSSMAYPYYFAEEDKGEYYISIADYAPYVMNGETSPIKLMRKENDGSLWRLKKVETYSVSLNDIGMATLCVDFDLEIPEGINVYVAESITQDGVIKLKSIDCIPAGTPVLISGEKQSTVTFNIVGRRYPTYTGNNIFTGAFFKNNNLKKKTYFTLKKDGDQPVMKLATLSGLASANSAYILLTDDLPNLSLYTFDFEHADGVETARIRKGFVHSTYDALGRRTHVGCPGFYIYKGKKYIR